MVKTLPVGVKLATAKLMLMAPPLPPFPSEPPLPPLPPFTPVTAAVPAPPAPPPLLYVPPLVVLPESPPWDVPAIRPTLRALTVTAPPLPPEPVLPPFPPLPPV